MKITVFGDIMWNYKLLHHSSLPIECSSRSIGGTLFNIAVAAKKHFDEVVAVGAIGMADYEIINDKFAEMGINAQLEGVPNISTGACVLTYNNGLRKSILSFRQANMCLSHESIDLANLFTSDFLFVNGWSFLPKSETSKVLVRVLCDAHERNIPIIFDILPHHIQEDEMSDDYLSALELSNIVICETRGQYSNPRTVNLSALRSRLKHSDLFILFDWINKFRVINGDGKCLAEDFTNYHRDSGIGFLDEIALQQVITYFPCRPERQGATHLKS